MSTSYPEVAVNFENAERLRQERRAEQLSFGEVFEAPAPDDISELPTEEIIEDIESMPTLKTTSHRLSDNEWRDDLLYYTRQTVGFSFEGQYEEIVDRRDAPSAEEKAWAEYYGLNIVNAAGVEVAAVKE